MWSGRRRRSFRNWGQDHQDHCHRIGSSQEPTKIAQKLLAEKGWKLDATYVTDIVQPNHVVSNGEYDANFFQHGAYLEQFKKDQNVDVDPAFYMYSSPAGVYSKSTIPSRNCLTVPPSHCL